MRIDDRLFGLLVALLGVAVLRHIAGFPDATGQSVGPAMFPGLIGWGFVLCGGALLVGGLRKSGLRGPLLGFADWRASPRRLAGVIGMLAAIVTFARYGEFIGFPVLSFTTLLLLYRVAGRGWIASVVFALAVTVGLALLFGKLLSVPLPPGLLG